MEPAQQLGRFGTLLTKLAEFPDRDLIYQIWQAAKLGLETGQIALATEFTGAMMDLLDDDALAPGRRVPLLYALDAIVKNVGGAYQLLFSQRLEAVFRKSFGVVNDKDKLRMHHVLRTWNDKKFFVEHLDELNAVVAPWHIALTAAQQKPAYNPTASAIPAALQVRRTVAPAKPVALAPAVVRHPPRPREQPQQPPTNSYAEFQAQRRRQRQLMMQKGPSEPQPPQPPNPVQQRVVNGVKPLAVKPLAVTLPGQEPPPGAQPSKKKILKKPKVAPVNTKRGRFQRKQVQLPEDKEEPGVVALAREQLYDLQVQMNEPNPMSLEEVAQRKPGLFEQIIHDSRHKLATKRQQHRLLEEWPPAVEPGPPAGGDATACAHHALRVANALDYRAAAFSRGAAPENVKKSFVDQAERLAGHLRTLCRMRERILQTAEHTARGVAEEVRTTLASQAEKRQRRDDLRRRRRLRGGGEDEEKEELQMDAEAEEAEFDELGAAQLAALKAARMVPPRVAFLSAEFLAAYEGDLQRIVIEAPVDTRAIDALSGAMPFYSQQDGLRFGTRHELQQHTKKLAGKKQHPKKAPTIPKAESRSWGPTQFQWTNQHLFDLQVECTDLREKLAAAKSKRDSQRHKTDDSQPLDDRVPAPIDASEVRCRISGEPFNIAWDDDGNGFLDGAVYVPVEGQEPTIVHINCRDATCGKGGTLTPDQLLPTTDVGGISSSEDLASEGIHEHENGGTTTTEQQQQSSLGDGVTTDGDQPPAAAAESDMVDLTEDDAVAEDVVMADGDDDEALNDLL